MSRKLIFASGLLLCFSCTLDPELQTTISTEKDVIKLHLVKHIREFVRQSPLEILAKSIRQFSVSDRVQEDLFSSYSRFLEILADDESRKRLETLRAEHAAKDPVFLKVKEISSVFERCLDHIFFENPQLAPLIRKYGVF